MNVVELKVMPDFCSRRHPFHVVTALSVLKQMGIEIRNVDILAVGEFENYRGEVRQQKPGPGTELGDNTKIMLEVGCVSAVDYLPYQMFYGLQGVTPRTGAWEEKARHLMAPFDAAVIRHDGLARYDRLRYAFGVVDIDHLLRYLELFGFEPFSPTDDVDEILFWVSVMPRFHRWAGNPRMIEKVLRRIFGYDFRMVENVSTEHVIPDQIQSRLGKSSSIGHDFLVGRSFKECDSAYELHIRGVSPANVRRLLPGQPQRRKLEWMLSTCMPNNMACRVKITVDGSGFVLGRNRENRYLGYSSFV